MVDTKRTTRGTDEIREDLGVSSLVRGKLSSRVIAIIVLLLITVIVAAFAINGSFSDKPATTVDRPDVVVDQPLSDVDQAELNLQESSAESVQATLNVYYALYGSYPITIDELKDDIAADAKHYGGGDAGETFASTISNLPEFDYTARGDREAYKFTYTDVRGKDRKVEGNYKEDYH